MCFRRKILTIFFCISFYLCAGQYTGGSYDGFHQSFLIKTTITDSAAFKGGNDDGFYQSFLAKTTITDADAFKGGSDDGYVLTLLPKTVITDADAFRGGSDDGHVLKLLSKTIITDTDAFRGGNDDGFVLAVLPKTIITDVIAFRGGNDDGFAFTRLNKTNITDAIVFYGGIGRGETVRSFINFPCTGDSVVWNGSASIAWENPENWSCGILPNVSSVVIIPSGMPRYPTVSFSYEIKSLHLQPGTTITVLPAVLFKLNGQ